MDGCMEGCMDEPCRGVVPTYVRMIVRTQVKNVCAYVLYLRLYAYVPLRTLKHCILRPRFRPTWDQATFLSPFMYRGCPKWTN